MTKGRLRKVVGICAAIAAIGAMAYVLFPLLPRPRHGPTGSVFDGSGNRQANMPIQVMGPAGWVTLTTNAYGGFHIPKGGRPEVAGYELAQGSTHYGQYRFSVRAKHVFRFTDQDGKPVEGEAELGWSKFSPGVTASLFYIEETREPRLSSKGIATFDGYPAAAFVRVRAADVGRWLVLDAERSWSASNSTATYDVILKRREIEVKAGRDDGWVNVDWKRF